MSRLAESIASGTLTNGLGSKGDEELSPILYPKRPLHVLLATSGSVASIKAPLIVKGLLDVSICWNRVKVTLLLLINLSLQFDQVEVQVVATQSSLHFYDAKSIQDESDGRVKVWVDADEWEVSHNRPPIYRTC